MHNLAWGTSAKVSANQPKAILAGLGVTILIVVYTLAAQWLRAHTPGGGVLASVVTGAGAVGVWRRAGEGGLRFVPLKLGASDLGGRVQVREGLAAGDEIVVYSEAGLRAGRRTEVVAALDGAGK